MPVAGIIAEYNPFHNGHLHHLQETKRRLSDCALVCVMSGHFLQRGEPALADKWARAEMAVAQGVDLVLELPVLYSCRSAYWFGRGGLALLAATGIITHFSFGAEDDNISQLERTAQFLAQENADFQEALRQNLKRGLSYPRARAMTLDSLLDINGELWSKPNNVLALAYLRAVQELKLPLIPLPIRRSGSAYHAEQLKPGENPSATAIRTYINSVPRLQFPDALAQMQDFLPAGTQNILAREYRSGRCPVQLEDLAPQILTLLRRSTVQELSEIVDVSEGLESRLKEAALSATTLSGFLNAVKTKRYTYTRLQRFLIHLLLNYTKEKETVLPDGPPYLRVLAFNQQGQLLLKELKKKTSLPVITKDGHSRRLSQLDSTFRICWGMDSRDSDL